jgi:hypothetical protein
MCWACWHMYRMCEGGWPVRHYRVQARQQALGKACRHCRHEPGWPEVSNHCRAQALLRGLLLQPCSARLHSAR